MRKWLNKTGNDLSFIGTFCVLLGLFKQYVINEPVITATEVWQSGLLWLIFGTIVSVFTSTKES